MLNIYVYDIFILLIFYFIYYYLYIYILIYLLLFIFYLLLFSFIIKALEEKSLILCMYVSDHLFIYFHFKIFVLKNVKLIFGLF